MVKLRVTVRILPENEYLATFESIAASQGPIRGEKKFHVVVQEPEKWYIGTLAVAVKQKYQNLYKHDLGQIKYLKNDDDDCDLDPEEGVIDVLVNEGRALTDQSDQNVTIKVVREQGRAIRQGSVLPDLTPIHYQLPTRPPVPRFENLHTSLGKRIADSADIDTHASKRKRTTLAEIEENEGIASSIEKDPTAHVVIQNSQPTQRGPEASTSSDFLDGPREPLWSFSQIGPPSVVEAPTPQQTLIQVGSGTVLRTQSTSPAVGGSSSARKRFLKPARDLYGYPESDIDDSSATARSPQVSKIMPRLVSNRTNGVGSASESSIAADDLLTHEQSSASARDDQIAAKSPNNRAEPKARKRIRTKASESTVQLTGASQSTIDIRNAASATSGGSVSVDSHISNGTSLPKPKDVPTAVTNRNSKKNQVNGTSDISEITSTEAKRKRRGVAASGKSVRESGRRQERQLSTPPPDSPSEQLSQSLRESAKKSVSTSLSQMTRLDSVPAQSRAEGSGASKTNSENGISRSPSATSSGRLGLGITDSPRKSRPFVKSLTADVEATKLTPPTKNPKNAAKIGADPRKRSNSNTAFGSDLADLNKPKTAVSKKHVSAATSKGNAVTPGNPAPPISERAQSTESNIVKSSTVILPPGMSQTEFDRIIADNAHLNLESKKAVAKRKSTPLLRKSVSRSSEPDVIKPLATGKKNISAVSSGAVLPTTMSKKSSSLSSSTSVNLNMTDDQSNAASDSPPTLLLHKAPTSEKVDENIIQAKPTAKGPQISEKDKKAASLSTPRPSKAVSEAASSISDRSGSKKKAVTSSESTASRNIQDSTPSVSSKTGPMSKLPPITPSKFQASMPPPGSVKLPPKSTILQNANASHDPKSRSSGATSDLSAKAKQNGLTATSNTNQDKAPATTAIASQAKRPTLTGPNSIYSARSLKELARLSGSTYNSPSTSTVASPAITTQHRTSFLGKSLTGGNKTKSLYGDDDETSSSDDDDDDSSSSSDGSSPPASKTDKNKAGNQIRTPAGKALATNTNSAKGKKVILTPAPKRPDPTIRDASVSVDDDSGSESNSSDGDS